MFAELEKALEDQDFKTAQEDAALDYMSTLDENVAVEEMLDRLTVDAVK
jgi:hypothetical protein